MFGLAKPVSSVVKHSSAAVLCIAAYSKSLWGLPGMFASKHKHFVCTDTKHTQNTKLVARGGEARQGVINGHEHIISLLNVQLAEHESFLKTSRKYWQDIKMPVNYVA